MRLIVLGVCLFAAACSGQASNSPTSPTNASLGPAQTAARGGTALPFRGSFTTVTDVPPPSAHATAEGTATHLGRFTGTLTAEVTSDNTSTGTFNFTAANGDQLSGTFVGIEGVFIPPNTAQDYGSCDDRERNRSVRGGHWNVYDGEVRHDRFRDGQGDWNWNVRREDQLEQMKDAFAHAGRFDAVRLKATVGPPSVSDRDLSVTQDAIQRSRRHSEIRRVPGRFPGATHTPDARSRSPTLRARSYAAQPGRPFRQLYSWLRLLTPVSHQPRLAEALRGHFVSIVSVVDSVNTSLASSRKRFSGSERSA